MLKIYYILVTLQSYIFQLVEKMKHGCIRQLKYSSSKFSWCYLLFCICCYYPYMLRLYLMNNLPQPDIAIRVVQLQCLTSKFCIESPENLWRISFHSWRKEQRGISITRAHSDTLIYFYVQYPKRMLFRFNPT